MKIIILGAGQVGRTAAYHLAREEANDVTVVDTNDKLLRDLQDRLDIRTVSGNAAHPNILAMAGAANAQAAGAAGLPWSRITCATHRLSNRIPDRLQRPIGGSRRR